MPLPVAVLVSGSGSNLQSIIDTIEAGVLDADIRVVIANKPDAYGLERARSHGLSWEVVDHREFITREAFDAELVRAIRERGADTVVLAGFMRMLTPVLLDAFPGRVLNIHPALLPSFPGVHGARDAWEYGVRVSGCTVHFVDEKMDHGPIVIQAAVPVLPDDDEHSLAGRILQFEHRIYPQAIQWLAQGRLRIEGRRVRVTKASASKADVESEYGVIVNPALEDGF
jgi:phosphoribosylglycinamide formyltransferase-1